jgi:hypothetical protein
MSQTSICNSAVFPPYTVARGLTGNVGGLVGPDFANNINIVGNTGLLVTGDPMTYTLTVSTGGPGTASFDRLILTGQDAPGSYVLDTKWCTYA